MAERRRRRRRRGTGGRLAGGFVAGAIVGLLAAIDPVIADTLDAVVERGSVRCGVTPDLTGFAESDSLGTWHGFDIDFCRAVAAAVLGDENAIEIVAAERPAARRDALDTGRVDLLSGATAHVPWGGTVPAVWIGPLLHDGQTFLAARARGTRSALELDGDSVCVVGGGVAERALRDFFATTGLDIRLRLAGDPVAAFDDYLDGSCGALGADRTALAARRARLERPERHVLLAETIAKRPRGALVRADDARWADVVRWTRHCLIDAEELGIGAENAAERAGDDTLAVRTLLGLEGRTGAALGLRRDWCASAVSRVGNHGELHARHLGPDTPLALERGLDAPWTEGGLLYAPPMH